MCLAYSTHYTFLPDETEYEGVLSMACPAEFPHMLILVYTTSNSTLQSLFMRHIHLNANILLVVIFCSLRDFLGFIRIGSDP